MPTLEAKIPPVVVWLFLGATMGATARPWPVLDQARPVGWIIAASLAITGLVIALLGGFSFRRAGTTVNPLQPAAASQLVVDGIYRRTRNPMYLGMLLALLGWGVLLANPLAFVLAVAFIPLMNRLQIGPEERCLTARFGTVFTAYRSSVRRWL